MKIARVLPRRTSATPDNELAFIGDPPLFLPAADEVHVSCRHDSDAGNDMTEMVTMPTENMVLTNGPDRGKMILSEHLADGERD